MKIKTNVKAGTTTKGSGFCVQIGECPPPTSTAQ
jgi:hypothetical protein